MSNIAMLALRKTSEPIRNQRWQPPIPEILVNQRVDQIERKFWSASSTFSRSEIPVEILRTMSEPSGSEKSKCLGLHCNCKYFRFGWPPFRIFFRLVRTLFEYLNWKVRPQKNVICILNFLALVYKLSYAYFRFGQPPSLESWFPVTSGSVLWYWRSLKTRNPRCSFFKSCL